MNKISRALPKGRALRYNNFLQKLIFTSIPNAMKKQELIQEYLNEPLKTGDIIYVRGLGSQTIYSQKTYQFLLYLVNWYVCVISDRIY